jgi:hypothetical protein
MNIDDFIPNGDPKDSDHRNLLRVCAACEWKDLVGKLLKCIIATSAGSPSRPTGELLSNYLTPTLSPWAIPAGHGNIERIPEAPSLSVKSSQMSVVRMLLDHAANPNGRWGCKDENTVV